MRAFIVFFLAVASVLGQYADFSTQTTATNLSAAMNSKPAFSAGTSLPATCTAHLDFYLNTSTTPGKLYECVATNTWAQVPMLVGSLTSGHCPQFDTNGNLVDSGTTNCGGGGGATWGAIGGTLASQTDLNTALAGKLAANGTAATATALATTPSQCVGNNVATGISSTGDANCNGLLHSISIPIAGAPIVTGPGSVGLPYSGVQFSCTSYTRAAIIANASGSITVDVWKANGAIPSSANKISGTSPVTLSAAQVNQSSSLTGWTPGAAAGDIYWASVATFDGALTSAVVQLWCK